MGDGDVVRHRQRLQAVEPGGEGAGRGVADHHHIPVKHDDLVVLQQMCDRNAGGVAHLAPVLVVEQFRMLRPQQQNLIRLALVPLEYLLKRPHVRFGDSFSA